MSSPDALSRPCPLCAAVALTRSDEVTTEGSIGPWQDTDGKWYDGPSRQFTVTRCGVCGWSEQITRRRGKIVHSVTTQLVTEK